MGAAGSACLGGAPNRHAQDHRARARRWRTAVSGEVGAQALTQDVDRDERAVRLVLPERPAVASIEALNMRSDAVDRTGRVGADQRSVGAHLGAMTLLRALKHGARRQ